MSSFILDFAFVSSSISCRRIELHYLLPQLLFFSSVHFHVSIVGMTSHQRWKMWLSTWWKVIKRVRVKYTIKSVCVSCECIVWERLSWRLEKRRVRVWGRKGGGTEQNINEQNKTNFYFYLMVRFLQATKLYPDVHLRK